MGAGNADRVLVGLHNFAPGLGPLEDGNPGGPGGGDLRVVVVGGGGADNAGRAFNILGVVSDGHGNSFVFQLSGSIGFTHIGACYLHAHALEHQSQGAHGNAADADQVHMTAGREIFGDFLILKYH